MTMLNEMNKELSRLFDKFNKKYFDNELPKPVLTIQTNSGNRNSLGWFSTQKIWKNEEENEYYHEINISAEYIYRDYELICATLIHEMVHLYCSENNIKDTSRGGSYHNKRFKSEAEKRGLLIGYNKRIGHSPTTLKPETLKFIEKIKNESVFSLTRLNHKGESLESPTETDVENISREKRKRGNSRKYACEDCGVNVRATREVNIICGECGQALTECD